MVVSELMNVHWEIDQFSNITKENITEGLYYGIGAFKHSLSREKEITIFYWWKFYHEA